MALQFSSPQIHMASTRIFPSKCNGGGEVAMRDLSFTTFSLSKRTWTSLKVVPLFEGGWLILLHSVSIVRLFVWSRPPSIKEDNYPSDHDLMSIKSTSVDT